MKKIIIILLTMILAQANEVKLTKEQIKSWDIKSIKPIEVDKIPLGDYMVEVTTPVTLIQTVSLPYEAQVISLNVALFQRVKKGEVLATVTSKEWINAQKSAISDAIELKHHKNIAARKNRLCKEHIIPKKECIAANAELKTDMIKVEASKELLKSYGAIKQMIDELFANLKISSHIPIISPTDGTIVKLNAYPGKSTAASSALFVIQKDGALWLESDLPLEKTKILQSHKDVILKINNKEYKSKILHIAPTINRQNQTRHVRFSLPKDSGLLPGLRTSAVLIVKAKAYKVPQKAVIKLNSKHTIFIFLQDGETFKNISVDIVGEDREFYYIETDKELNLPVVVSGVAVLKNMMGDSDE